MNIGQVIRHQPFNILYLFLTPAEVLTNLDRGLNKPLNKIEILACVAIVVSVIIEVETSYCFKNLK